MLRYFPKSPNSHAQAQEAVSNNEQGQDRLRDKASNTINLNKAKSDTPGSVADSLKNNEECKTNIVGDKLKTLRLVEDDFE